MAALQGVTAGRKPRLLDRVREIIRRKYYSHRTEEAYVHWIKRFIYFTGKRCLPVLKKRALRGAPFFTTPAAAQLMACEIKQ